MNTATRLAATIGVMLLLAGCGSAPTGSASGAIEVPDVTGQELPAAKATLTDLGLKVTTSAPDATFGVVNESNWVVESQSPPAGSSVQEGTKVELVVKRPDDEPPSSTTEPPTTPAPTDPPTTPPTTPAPTEPPTPAPTEPPPPPPPPPPAASDVYYPNCAAVRAAGAAPLYEGQPGYSSRLDRDGDGIACE